MKIQKKKLGGEGLGQGSGKGGGRVGGGGESGWM